MEGKPIGLGGAGGSPYNPLVDYVDGLRQWIAVHSLVF
jgi:hypothetical protein